MSAVESKDNNRQARSFTPLIRVLLVFPFIIILGSLFGKKVTEAFELTDPVYFLAFVGISTILGWVYVWYEYKRTRALLQIENHEEE